MVSEQFEELMEFRSGDNFPSWATDGVNTTVDIRLDFWDRVKVLFGCGLSVSTFTATENKVGNVESKSCVHVLRHPLIVKMDCRGRVYGVVDSESD